MMLPNAPAPAAFFSSASLPFLRFGPQPPALCGRHHVGSGLESGACRPDDLLFHAADPFQPRHDFIDGHDAGNLTFVEAPCLGHEVGMECNLTPRVIGFEGGGFGSQRLGFGQQLEEHVGGTSHLCQNLVLPVPGEGQFGIVGRPGGRQLSRGLLVLDGLKLPFHAHLVAAHEVKHPAEARDADGGDNQEADEQRPQRQSFFSRGRTSFLGRVCFLHGWRCFSLRPEPDS